MCYPCPPYLTKGGVNGGVAYRFWEPIQVSIETAKDTLMRHNQHVVLFPLQLQNHFFETVCQIIVGLEMIKKHIWQEPEG